MRTFRLLPLLSVAAVTLGCAEASPTAPSALELAGSWTLVSIQPVGQTEQATPAGATYTLSLSDGRLSTRADCNTCNGSFTLSGLTLSAGPALACTRAACPTMAFESIYTSLLGGDSSITVSGDTLLLESTRGTLRFGR
jgi:heat shock protein HslJ